MGEKKHFLQSVTRYTDNNSGSTGFKAIYSDGLDSQTLLFPIKSEYILINIPSFVKAVMTLDEINQLGAEIN